MCAFIKLRFRHPGLYPTTSHMLPLGPAVYAGDNRPGDQPVQLWQWVIFVFIVLVPLALMVDFWGDQRLTFRGRPGRRTWRPVPLPAPSPDDHH